MWSYKKCGIAALRLAVFTALVTALFWGIWSLFAPVPVVTEIVWGPKFIIELPFALSVGTYVLFMSVVSAILSVMYGRSEEKADFTSDLIVSLCVVLAVGLGFGFSASLAYVLVTGLFIGLVASVVWIAKKLCPFLFGRDID